MESHTRAFVSFLVLLVLISLSFISYIAGVTDRATEAKITYMCVTDGDTIGHVAGTSIEADKFPVFDCKNFVQGR